MQTKDFNNQSLWFVILGAVVGGVRGRRSKVVGDERQQQANDAGAAAMQKELANDYNKAFTACMEGKGYTVK